MITSEFKYWVAAASDGTFSIYRRNKDTPRYDTGFLMGDFSTREAAEECMRREQEFDASDFGKEFNEALANEDWS